MSTSDTSGIFDESNTSTGSSAAPKRWSAAETKKLNELLKEHIALEDSDPSAIVDMEEMWEILSAQMREHGFYRTPRAIQGRFSQRIKVERPPTKKSSKRDERFSSGSEVDFPNLVITPGSGSRGFSFWTDAESKKLFELLKAHREKAISSEQIPLTGTKLWKVLSGQLQEYGTNRSQDDCAHYWQNGGRAQYNLYEIQNCNGDAISTPTKYPSTAAAVDMTGTMTADDADIPLATTQREIERDPSRDYDKTPFGKFANLFDPTIDEEADCESVQTKSTQLRGQINRRQSTTSNDSWNSDDSMYLKIAFNNDPQPSPRRLEDIATKMNKAPEDVDRWFQSRRADVVYKGGRATTASAESIRSSSQNAVSNSNYRRPPVKEAYTESSSDLAEPLQFNTSPPTSTTTQNEVSMASATPSTRMAASEVVSEEEKPQEPANPTKRVPKITHKIPKVAPDQEDDAQDSVVARRIREMKDRRAEIRLEKPEKGKKVEQLRAREQALCLQQKELMAQMEEEELCVLKLDQALRMARMEKEELRMAEIRLKKQEKAKKLEQLEANDQALWLQRKELMGQTEREERSILELEHEDTRLLATIKVLEALQISSQANRKRGRSP